MSDTGDFRATLKANIGSRVSIRLHDSDGGLRDLLGVLHSETSLINRRGELCIFDPNQIALLRVVPVFNRMNQRSGQLSMYNTFSRKVDVIGEGREEIAMYCCGPTVYRDAHVGNLRTFLLADLISRALQLSGKDVRLIQNITDVGHMSDDLDDLSHGDKLLDEAARTKIEPFTIAREYERRFHADLALINISPADSYPRASENMNRIITSISQLIEKGSAYLGSDGNVYFDARRFESYGAISGNKLENLKPGHRYEFVDEGGKGFHADWALWKLAHGRTQMIWDSPWGPGFPGWHIECTSMSLELLDNDVDIHVGGIDLRFPHHENERAQSNTLASTEVVKHWVHGEHLLFEGRKMSKSAGNVVLISDLIDRGLDPLALRLALQEHRYRSQMDLTWASIEAAHQTLKRWRRAMSSWGQSLEEKFDEEFNSAIMSDLDTPRALQRIRAIEKDPTIGAQDKRALFLYADQVLGLDLGRLEEVQQLTSGQEELLSKREQARASKNYSESDRLRDELEAQGILVHDSLNGQSWSWK